MNMTVSKAIKMSWASLSNFSILIRLLIPVFFTIGIGIWILSWGRPLITTEFVPFLKGFYAINWFFGFLDSWLGFSLLEIFALFLFILIVFIVNYFILIILTSLILVPLLTPIVQKQFFPRLSETEEIGWLDSIKNTFIGTTIFLAALILGSPLFFIPGGQVIYPFFLNSYLAKKIFPLDVLQNYATKEEFEKFLLKEKKPLWTLAFLTNGYVYVPILNFFAAPLIALAFIFFCLGKISDYRATS